MGLGNKAPSKVFVLDCNCEKGSMELISVLCVHLYHLEYFGAYKSIVGHCHAYTNITNRKDLFLVNLPSL